MVCTHISLVYIRGSPREGTLEIFQEIRQPQLFSRLYRDAILYALISFQMYKVTVSSSHSPLWQPMGRVLVHLCALKSLTFSVKCSKCWWM